MHWAPSATWADLQDLLIDVLHFIGHGDFDPGHGEGVLALVREDGRANLVAAHRMTDLLHQARPMPRLVVLNSCSVARRPGNLPNYSSTAVPVGSCQFQVCDGAPSGSHPHR